jgi:hypothetical protein
VPVATSAGRATTALLFRRDAVDEVDDWAGEIEGLGRSSILWIDLERPDEGALRELVETLDLNGRSAEALT